MSDTKAYEEKQRAKLAEWRAEIDKLKAKANQASAAMKIEYERRIVDLQEKVVTAEAKLDVLRTASEDAWDDIKQGLESAIHDVGEGFKAAASKFKH
ncbi:MAG: hypothetical protein PF589_07380 [Gammaproteobacteria bacterium]|nr:hypothetical protein [Gammaproteobacteria bacterium]